MSTLTERPEVLQAIPARLRTELLTAFDAILRNYRERRWEPSELNGGKLCEVVYSILRGHVDGKYPRKATKPRNMVDACRAFEQAPKTFSRSVRVHIPRVLIALYEVRNNRGVGHVGGDVDPNMMDAELVLAFSKWVVAELVRLFHGLEPEDATAVVELISERVVPVVWVVDGKRRILDTGMTMREKTLVLLYHSSGPLKEGELLHWTEHSNASTYRRDVLRRAHREKLIEYDEVSRTAVLSPLGVRYVEEGIALEI